MSYRLRGYLRAVEENKVSEYHDYLDYQKGKITIEEYRRRTNRE